MRQLVADLERAGEWTAARTNGGHIKLTHVETGGVVFCATSPSDWRAVANTRRKIARIEQGTHPPRNMTGGPR